MALKNVVDNNETVAGKIFSFFFQFLILISLISFSVETLPNIDEQSIKILNLIELICIILFTIEYALRIIASTNKWKYVFSFYGLIDLFAILPFYVTTGVDLRSIRIFRFLRLFRIFKFNSFQKAINRFSKVFSSIKEELFVFLMTSLFLIYVSAVGIYYFEHDVQPEHFASIFHSLWWAIITLTTVGYGDAVPITIGGKCFTFVILLIGLGIIAVPSGLIASAMNRAVKDD